MRIEVAVAVGHDGHIVCCGPHDYDKSEHGSAIDAARSWLAEGGHILVASYRVHAVLPEHVTEIEGRTEKEANK